MFNYLVDFTRVLIDAMCHLLPQRDFYISSDFLQSYTGKPLFLLPSVKIEFVFSKIQKVFHYEIYCPTP